MPDPTDTAGREGLNIEAAVRLLIARVDRLERVLRNVREAMPHSRFIEPLPLRETDGPSDRQSLAQIGRELEELGSNE